MENTLLDFFNSRNTFVQEKFAFTTNSDNTTKSDFIFIVSNHKQDEDNTIKLDSIDSLEMAVKVFFTTDDCTDKIKLSQDLDKDKPMFVHLMLKVKSIS